MTAVPRNGVEKEETTGAYRLRVRAKRIRGALLSLALGAMGLVGAIGGSYFKARAAEAPEKSAEARELGGVAATVNQHDQELKGIREHLGQVDTSISGIQSDMRVLLCAMRPDRPECFGRVFPAGPTPQPKPKGTP